MWKLRDGLAPVNTPASMAHKYSGVGRTGQAVIEFTIALLVLLLLFAGTVKLWLWFDRLLVWRQRRYDTSRPYSGGNLRYFPPEQAF